MTISQDHLILAVGGGALAYLIWVQMNGRTTSWTAPESPNKRPDQTHLTRVAHRGHRERAPGDYTNHGKKIALDVGF